MSQPYRLVGRRRFSRRLRLFGLPLLAIAIVAIPGQGDVVILKDGYAIHGKVIEEQSTIRGQSDGPADRHQKNERLDHGERRRAPHRFQRQLQARRRRRPL